MLVSPHPNPVYNALHYVTLRYITLHYITLRYITLHYVTIRYNTLHITLHYVTIRYVTLRYVTLPYVTLRNVCNDNGFSDVANMDGTLLLDAMYLVITRTHMNYKYGHKLVSYSLFLIRKGIRNKKYVSFLISYLIRNKE